MSAWVFSFFLLIRFSRTRRPCFLRQLLDTHGVRLNVLGKTELLPASVQAAVLKAEDMTRHNDRCVPLSLIWRRR